MKTVILSLVLLSSASLPAFADTVMASFYGTMNFYSVLQSPEDICRSQAQSALRQKCFEQGGQTVANVDINLEWALIVSGNTILGVGQMYCQTDSQADCE
jgi:hypothetical protein